jgi:YHS domain-containing protein
MNELQDLLDRIDAETSVQQERHRRLQQERVDAFEQRTRRYQELFLPAFDRLQKVWAPRLQLLAEKSRCISGNFGESVEVISEIRPSQEEPHSGETSFAFRSPLARIRVSFGFYHDVNVENIVLENELEIIPVFVKFDAKSRLEQPVATFDEAAAAEWLDDRIIAFVRTYVAMHENSTYVADQMVEDPVAQVRFPKYEAKSTAEKNGTTFYFISPATMREFEKAEPLAINHVARPSEDSATELVSAGSHGSA